MLVDATVVPLVAAVARDIKPLTGQVAATAAGWYT
jgi:hypothetical protein